MRYRHADDQPFTLGDATAYDLYRLANAGIPDGPLLRALAGAMPKERPAATVREAVTVEWALEVYRRFMTDREVS